MQQHHLYFFVYPPPELRGRMQALGVAQGNMGRPMPAARIHITLQPLGGYESPAVREVRARAEAAASSVQQEQFDVAFNRLGSHGSPEAKSHLTLTGRAPVLDGLRRLRAALGVALERHGLHDERPRRNFHPHVTLDYDHRLPVRRSVPPLAWTVTEFCLVDSLHGLGRHEELARWPLQAPRQMRFPGW